MGRGKRTSDYVCYVIARHSTLGKREISKEVYIKVLLGASNKFVPKLAFAQRGDQVSFPLGQVPTELVCPHCGGSVRQAPLSEGFEILVAGWLGGELAATRQEGYDVYKSALFPKRTFQVKHAYPIIRDTSRGSTLFFAR